MYTHVGTYVQAMCGHCPNGDVKSDSNGLSHDTIIRASRDSYSQEITDFLINIKTRLPHLLSFYSFMYYNCMTWVSRQKNMGNAVRPRHPQSTFQNIKGWLIIWSYSIPLIFNRCRSCLVRQSYWNFDRLYVISFHVKVIIISHSYQNFSSTLILFSKKITLNSKFINTGKTKTPT